MASSGPWDVLASDPGYRLLFSVFIFSLNLRKKRSPQSPDGVCVCPTSNPRTLFERSNFQGRLVKTQEEPMNGI